MAHGRRCKKGIFDSEREMYEKGESVCVCVCVQSLDTGALKVILNK